MFTHVYTNIDECTLASQPHEHTTVGIKFDGTVSKPQASNGSLAQFRFIFSS
jgi:hypothetical protein